MEAIVAVVPTFRVHKTDSCLSSKYSSPDQPNGGYSYWQAIRDIGRTQERFANLHLKERNQFQGLKEFTAGSLAGSTQSLALAWPAVPASV